MRPAPLACRRMGALAALTLAGCAAAPAAGVPVGPGSTAAATALPATDLFWATLEADGDGIRVGVPVRITDRDGYDNQPAFTSDGEALLYSSIGEDGQADILRYELRRNRHGTVGHTPESEYSPTPLPGGRGFSVVRVEADSTQRLWRTTPRGYRLVLPDVRPVGYHAWISPDTLALFVLGDPPTLRIASVRTGEAVVSAEGIGRSLHRVPQRHAVAFTDRRDPGNGWIRELDLARWEISSLAPLLPGSEDFAWAPDGSLLMASGTVLHRWMPGESERWHPVADLASPGAGAVTRLAVSPRGDRIAWVAARRR
jgi:hypothetical protein